MFIIYKKLKNGNSLDIKTSNIEMPIYQKFSKGVRLLALHIEYQRIGNAKIQNEMSNRSPHELWS